MTPNKEQAPANCDSLVALYACTPGGTMCFGPSQFPGVTEVAVGICGTMLCPGARSLALGVSSAPMSGVDGGFLGTVKPQISFAVGNATHPLLCPTSTQNGRSSKQGSTQEPRPSLHDIISKRTVIFAVVADFLYFRLLPKIQESQLV